MPASVPDASDYLRMKKLQIQLDVDKNVDARKFRNQNALQSYSPFGRILAYPPNTLLPGRLVTQPTPPAPPPSYIPGLIYEGYSNQMGTEYIDFPSSWKTRDDTKVGLLNIPGETDGEIIPYDDYTLDSRYTNIGVHGTGYYLAPVTGSYTFDLTSDDGLQLKIGNTLLVDAGGISNAGEHSTEAITLTAGTYYPFEFYWQNGTGSVQLRLIGIYVDGSKTSLMLTYPFFDSIFHL